MFLGKIWKEREEKLKLEHERSLSNAVRKVRAELKEQLEIEKKNIQEEYEQELKEHLKKILLMSLPEENQFG